MKSISQVFIDHPRLAWVVAIIIAICGGMTFAFFFVENLSNSLGSLETDRVKPFIICFIVFSFIWFLSVHMHSMD